MKLRNTIVVGLCMLAAAAGISVEAQPAKRKILPTSSGQPSFVRITQRELALLLEDVGAVNPAVLKGLAEDPELRRAQLDNLKQLLAFASQAQKDGLAAMPLHARELKYIRDETIAVNYDRHLNGGKGAMPPFNLISDTRVREYFGEASGSKLTAALKRARAVGFQEFFDTKVALLRAGNPEMKDRVVTDEEKQQARDLYARIMIYADEYANRSAVLPRTLREKANLQVKLQQAQFLARLYSEKIAPRTAVSDEEVANYVRAHPEYDISAKRAKAKELLSRAKGGEDFAKLANEFSEDPGNKNPQGEPQGGLYRNVSKGTMVPSFERAALALEAGQVSAELVESDYGFHIVKLERKGKTAGPDSAETYDVRHILISTAGAPGPDGSSVPVKVRIRGTLATEKEQRLIDALVTANKISVPADFAVPAAAEQTDAAKKPAAAPRPKAGSSRKPN